MKEIQFLLLSCLYKVDVGSEVQIQIKKTHQMINKHSEAIDFFIKKCAKPKYGNDMLLNAHTYAAEKEIFDFFSPKRFVAHICTMWTNLIGVCLTRVKVYLFQIWFFFGI